MIRILGFWLGVLLGHGGSSERDKIDRRDFSVKLTEWVASYHTSDPGGNERRCLGRVRHDQAKARATESTEEKFVDRGIHFSHSHLDY